MARIKTRPCVCPRTPQDASQLVLLRRGRLKSGKLSMSADVCQYVRREANWPQETISAMYLNNNNEVVGTVVIAKGGRSTAIVDQTSIFQGALLTNAASFILVHNHPSGDPTPSQHDYRLTKRVVKNGELLGIPLLDHVVVGERECVSFRDLGIIGTIEREMD